MKIAVGSTNPVKIQAVKEVFEEIFRDIEVVGIEVDSGVSNQPFNEEAIKGAINRAKNVLKLINTDYSVGIEGGVINLGKKWYNLGFIAIIDKEGKIGTGTSGWFECPPNILEKLEKGKELGEVMDEMTGRKDVKKQEGAIGVFTRGKVSRKDLYKHGILMALVPFLSPKVFKK